MTTRNHHRPFEPLSPEDQQQHEYLHRWSQLSAAERAREARREWALLLTLGGAFGAVVWLLWCLLP